MLQPGATIGILGGGQLGRMIALAAAQLGLKCHILCPDAESPAFDVAAARTVAAYDDEAALARFAEAIDVATYEFENVPGKTAEFLAARVPLHPNPRALAITQDRAEEKDFLVELGIPIAGFARVSGAADLGPALAGIGTPSVLKTRRFGYDGKGQAMIRQPAEAEAAFARLGGVPCVLEAFVPFAAEVSVIAARGVDGAFAAYDLCLNEHRDHILHRTTVPAGVEPRTEAQAVAIARAIATKLDYVGVLAVEMFLLRQGGAERLVVNEVAPRVHNSGHWTIEGAKTSQFEQHVRAICGWPLGATARLGEVEMTNLIGAEATAYAAFLVEEDAHLHLYGKAEARPGRKMGHVTRVASPPPQGEGDHAKHGGGGGPGQRWTLARSKPG